MVKKNKYQKELDELYECNESSGSITPTQNDPYGLRNKNTLSLDPITTLQDLPSSNPPYSDPPSKDPPSSGPPSSSPPSSGPSSDYRVLDDFMDSIKNWLD